MSQGVNRGIGHGAVGKNRSGGRGGESGGEICQTEVARQGRRGTGMTMVSKKKTKKERKGKRASSERPGDEM